MRAGAEKSPEMNASASLSAVPQAVLGARRHLNVDTLFVPIVLVALVITLTIGSPYFFTGPNLQNLLIQASVLGITAVGATFLIITGELDLSIGSNVALSGVVATIGMTSLSTSVPFGIALGVATGVAVGVVNGVVTCWLRVASFISTLGMLVIAAGVALELTNGATIAGVPRIFGAIANTELLGLRTLVWAMLAVFLLGYLTLRHTAFGI
jgi:ribose/xylose/arabinose/galactoside ABC-type transport system permease subunit